MPVYAGFPAIPAVIRTCGVLTRHTVTFQAIVVARRSGPNHHLQRLALVHRPVAVRHPAEVDGTVKDAAGRGWESLPFQMLSGPLKRSWQSYPDLADDAIDSR
jgi:hypothetical protein